MTAQTTVRSGQDNSQTFTMPVDMRLGAPTLRVRDLQATLAFYENDLGLQVKKTSRDPLDSLEVIQLGFKAGGQPILLLKHDLKALTPPDNFAGLYHYAVLVPDRDSLASTYLSIASTGAVFDGFADHGFSEALYLHDNERNGIEVYADRPRNAWPEWNKIVKAFKAGDSSALDIMTQPLDLDSLLRTLNSDLRRNPSWLPKGARIGHVHLRVTNLEKSVRFYSEKLGFDVGAYLPEMGAAFLSVGGYHHNIGLNTWHSRGGKPHEQGEAGLENFIIEIPDGPYLNTLGQELGTGLKSQNDEQVILTDPDGIEIRVQVKKTGR